MKGGGVNYQKKLTELGSILVKNKISGSVLRVLQQNGNMAVIEAILREKMKMRVDTKTLHNNCKFLKMWLDDTSGRLINRMSAQQIAQMFMQLPLQNLKRVILENDLDGLRFAADDDDEIEMMIQYQRK